MNAVKSDKSGGECGEKNLNSLVAVKLHNFAAEFSSEITEIHRFEQKCPKYVR